MEFVYGKVPDNPVIPHSAFISHKPHGACELGDILYVIIADLGRNPIPYAVMDMDTCEVIAQPTDHQRDFFEGGLMSVLPIYLRGRN